ncbi:unnamed protein product [Vitrella brassicaformis CCMP3155]|uniref:EF-hand domain-containing protein n=3 Tax=Vitrella brassicaformis TaxID=1169539 RepID=A0A0G4EIT3_VITBC|nr:unnamed protein product [Vitrella brassicaformis CCMP3155]|eukprot:CEL95908.1 unnamed protein product [Vitrella brassicaformis CCMP3155]
MPPASQGDRDGARPKTYPPKKASRSSFMRFLRKAKSAATPSTADEDRTADGLSVFHEPQQPQPDSIKSPQHDEGSQRETGTEDLGRNDACGRKEPSERPQEKRISRSHAWTDPTSPRTDYILRLLRKSLTVAPLPLEFDELEESSAPVDRTRRQLEESARQRFLSGLLSSFITRSSSNVVVDHLEQHLQMLDRESEADAVRLSVVSDKSIEWETTRKKAIRFLGRSESLIRRVPFRSVITTSNFITWTLYLVIFFLCMLHLFAEFLVARLPPVHNGGSRVFSSMQEFVAFTDASRPGNWGFDTTAEKGMYAALWLCLSVPCILIVVHHSIFFRSMIRSWTDNRLRLSLGSIRCAVLTQQRRRSSVSITTGPRSSVSNTSVIFERCDSTLRDDNHEGWRIRVLQFYWDCRVQVWQLFGLSGAFFWLMHFCDETLDMCLQLYTCLRLGGIDLLKTHDVPAWPWHGVFALSVLMGVHIILLNLVHVTKKRGWAILSSLGINLMYSFHLIISSSLGNSDAGNRKPSMGMFVSLRSENWVQFLSAFVPLCLAMFQLRAIDALLILKRFTDWKHTQTKTTRHRARQYRPSTDGSFMVDKASVPRSGVVATDEVHVTIRDKTEHTHPAGARSSIGITDLFGPLRAANRMHRLERWLILPLRLLLLGFFWGFVVLHLVQRIRAPHVCPERVEGWRFCAFPTHPVFGTTVHPFWPCNCRYYGASTEVTLTDETAARTFIHSLDDFTALEAVVFGFIEPKSFMYERGEGHYRGFRANVSETLPRGAFKQPYMRFWWSNAAHITSIPSGFADLPLLEYVSFALTRVGEIPNSFCDMKQLRTLHLGSSFVESLPPCLGHLRGHLKTFRLQSTPLCARLSADPDYPILGDPSLTPSSSLMALLQELDPCSLNQQAEREAAGISVSTSTSSSGRKRPPRSYPLSSECLVPECRRWYGFMTETGLDSDGDHMICFDEMKASHHWYTYDDYANELWRMEGKTDPDNECFVYTTFLRKANGEKSDCANCPWLPRWAI